MWLSALIFAIPGAILLFNLAQVADRLASANHILPQWLRGPFGDDPFPHRFLGGIFLAIAAFSVYEALAGR